MSVAAASNAMVTVTEIKRWLNLTETDTDRDDFLQDRINQWSDEIERRTGRVIGAADYTDEVHSGGRRSIMPLNPPVNSVSEITISSEELSSDDWFITADKSMIRLETGRPFRGGAGDILISYNGGFSATPGDISRALIQIVAIDYYLSGHGNQSLAKSAESFGGSNVSFNRSPSDQERMLGTVVRRYLRRHNG